MTCSVRDEWNVQKTMGHTHTIYNMMMTVFERDKEQIWVIKNSKYIWLRFASFQSGREKVWGESFVTPCITR